MNTTPDIFPPDLALPPSPHLPLRQLQCQFHDHLLGLPSSIQSTIVEGGIGPAHRLHIYYHAYRARLLENLQDAYEKTWAYLGDDRFATEALAYIEHHSPSHRSLRWYGATFPHWLAQRFPHDADIAELAVLDWQLRCAFDGPDATTLTPAVLATLTPQQWEHVGFHFIPTLTVTPITYNSPAIWQALDQEQTPPTAVALLEPTWLLIWRKAWQPHFRSMDAAEHQVLSTLLQGASFAQACEQLCQHHSEQDAPQVAARALHGWLHDGLVQALQERNPSAPPLL